MIFNLFAMCIGILLLIVGAELMIRACSKLAKNFNIPEILIGITIVSIGTSLPELIITIKSALQNSTDLIVGNSVGSNLCNLLLILGVMSLMKPLHVDKETKHVHNLVAFISTFLILSIAKTIGVINFSCAVILILVFLTYMLLLIFLNKKIIKEQYHLEEGEKLTAKQIFLQIILIIVGIILLKEGGDLSVDYASLIANELGVSERIIGLTIVAIGTSLPELVTSIVATVNNDPDLGLGNLIGSTIFNSLLVFGIGGIITPIQISAEFINNLILMVFSTALVCVFCFVPKKDTITRFNGLILVSMFVLYMSVLFI